MIQRFTFGCPLPTESVVLPVEPAAAAVPYLTAEPDGSWSFSLAEDAVVYGLGEMPRGINKRGWHYITNNTDEARHSEDKLSYCLLYTSPSPRDRTRSRMPSSA